MTVSIKYSEFNLGSQAHFKTDEENELREVKYAEDIIDPQFPLLFCESRIKECLEMNLFLIHRRLGIYSTKPNSKVKNQSPAFSKAYYATLSGEHLSHKSMEPIAKDLQAFLIWLVQNNRVYEEVIAAPLPSDSVEEQVASLPVWQYQKYLTKLVKTEKLSYKTAKRRLDTVKHFYLWSYKRSVISSLPFSMELKTIKVPKKNGDFDLFSLPTGYQQGKGVMNWVSNLGIPKSVIPKDSVPRELQPYSPEELVSLISTDFSKKPTYNLFLKCAYQGGFRSFEVVAINHADIKDPKEDDYSKFYYVNIIRKGHKPSKILISPNLMEQLYKYTLTKTWRKRRIKFETKYGMTEPLPLFINRDGERMREEAPSDTIGYIRLEQDDKGLPRLERDYHDLRATYGTYLAASMIINGESEERIKAVLMKVFSHEDFTTSELYLDLAKTMLDENEHGAMHMWVKDMYSRVDELMNALPDEAKQEEV
ncbi:site-specific integrase [Pseudoalteromonas sp. XMcav1-K]|uniref:site-specific integrase n=1 Tax=Pseudoalteromonas sp. XMcav1-K TaxID=3374372 RepID=UPI003757B249